MKGALPEREGPTRNHINEDVALLPEGKNPELTAFINKSLLILQIYCPKPAFYLKSL